MKKYPELSLISILTLSLFLSSCSQKKLNKEVSWDKQCTSTKRHKSSMKSYEVFGKKYYPEYAELGQKMYGISSWYGPNFHGKYTSNGEIYNMYAKTAAHKTWPMDTIVRVKNVQNSKSTIVRINDRGPFVDGRIIDCSYAAGKELGLDKMGIAKVEIEVVKPSDKNKIPSFVAKKNKLDLFRAKSLMPSNKIAQLSDIALQVGAFKRYEGAEIYKKEYANLYPQYKSEIRELSSEDGVPMYHVWIVGFKSEQEVEDFKNNILG